MMEPIPQEKQGRINAGCFPTITASLNSFEAVWSLHQKFYGTVAGRNLLPEVVEKLQSPMWAWLTRPEGDIGAVLEYAWRNNAEWFDGPQDPDTGCLKPNLSLSAIEKQLSLRLARLMAGPWSPEMEDQALHCAAGIDALLHTATVCLQGSLELLGRAAAAEASAGPPPAALAELEPAQAETARALLEDSREGAFSLTAREQLLEPAGATHTTRKWWLGHCFAGETEPKLEALIAAAHLQAAGVLAGLIENQEVRQRYGMPAVDYLASLPERISALRQGGWRDELDGLTAGRDWEAAFAAYK